MEHRLPHAPTAARRARRLARDLVRDLLPRARADEFVVMVSEIVGNAVRHGQPEQDGRIGLRLEAEEQVVRAVVVDGAPEFTFDRDTLKEDQDRHLGLLLVDGLADRWGLSLDGKKAVWVEVDMDHATTPHRRRA